MQTFPRRDFSLHELKLEEFSRVSKTFVLMDFISSIVNRFTFWSTSFINTDKVI
jgi:hypothetical protein